MTNTVIIEIELPKGHVITSDANVQPILDGWAKGIAASFLRNSNLKCNVKAYPKL